MKNGHVKNIGEWTDCMSIIIVVVVVVAVVLFFFLCMCSHHNLSLLHHFKNIKFLCIFHFVTS